MTAKFSLALLKLAPTRMPDKFKFIYLFCRAYFAAKLKPGRFPYLEDEARQVSLCGIVPCTHMKNSLELISYPSIFLLLLKFDNDVIIKLGRAACLWNEPSLYGHKWRNGARL